MILCDTNILIDFFRSKPLVLAQLANIGIGEISISAVTVAEMIHGVQNQAELRIVRQRLAALPVLPLTPAIGQAALDLLYQYRLSHALDFADALIAATALAHGLPLFTLNRKHFQYLPGLTIYEP